MNELKRTITVFLLLPLMLFVVFTGCVSNDTYMVEMRDGVKLATDVYLPDENILSHGTLLIRTPYNKNDMKLTGIQWSQAGWPVVIQDMRGRYASEGIDTVFRNAHTDGPDTLSWIANQSFCNGEIATFGGSALGINQYYMAGANPDFLACQYIQVATPDMYKHAIFQGGQFRYSLVAWWLEGQGSTYILEDYFAHENFTMDYWGNVSLDGKWDQVQVPAIHIGGWYDCFAQGTIDGFMGYQYQGGDGALGKSKLIMGPWTHGGGRKQGELLYPENAEDNFSFYMFIDMIEQYTMDTGNHFDKWPAVSYYVMGDVDNESAPGNEWLTAEDWPVPYETVPIYLCKDGSLQTTLDSESTSISYSYDPTDPAPTIGGQNLNDNIIKRGPYDQCIIEDRDDVLVFTSEVLSDPLWIAGPLRARLFVSSNCPDTDFTVKLTDVYPDGRSMLIADGILRMRNRHGFDHWEFMESSEIYEIEIDLWSTAYIFNKDHRIRISVSSSNAPRFLPNPNTIAPLAQNTSFAIAENTVYLGESYPSSFYLPVVSLHFEKEKQDSNDVLFSLRNACKKRQLITGIETMKTIKDQ